MTTSTHIAPERLVLMYHNVTCPGDSFGRIGESVTRYFVTAEQLTAQLEQLAGATSELWSSVDHFRVAPNGKTPYEAPLFTPKHEQDTPPIYCELTFDDGWAGSFDTAFDVLERFDMTATVFVTTGLIGQPHFVDAAGLRDAVASGRFRIGAHGVTHRLLETLSPDEVEYELQASKETLEDVLAAPVDTFALPGGSRSRVVIETARRLGYRELHTSTPSTCPLLVERPFFEIPRFPVLHSTTTQQLRNWLDKPVGVQAILKQRTLDLAKAVLGRRTYATLRGRLLGSAGDFDMTDLVPAEAFAASNVFAQS